MKIAVSRFAVLCACAALGTPFAVLAQSGLTGTITAPSGASSQDSEIVADQIVAVVNDEVITRNELRSRVHEIETQLQHQGTPLPPANIVEHQVLERLILERAQLQLAKEDGIRVDDFQLDRAVIRVAEANGMTAQQLREKVERDGTPYARMREEIRGEIMMQRLRDHEVDSTVQVSEGEIDNFLAEQNGANTAGQEVDIAQILVRVPEQASADQIEKARAKAADIYKQVQSGADFGKLAVTYSDAPEALAGGDLGWRPQDRYPQLFLDALIPLAPGQTAAPVKSPNGFHILKLVGRRSLGSGKQSSAVAPIQQTHVRHILIRTNEVMSAAQARARLLDIKARVVAKTAAFEDMARSYSNDGSAAKGGDLGYILPGDTVPEFEHAMNALKPGDISDPVETNFGWHLIQVLDRKTESLPQERLRQFARQSIHDRKADEAYQDWLRSLRDRTYVEMRLDER